MAITGKAAEDILERIFQPTTKPSARDQAEETPRHRIGAVPDAIEDLDSMLVEDRATERLPALVLLQLEVEPGQLPDQDFERALAGASLAICLLDAVESGKQLATQLVHDQVAVALDHRHRALHPSHHAPLRRQDSDEGGVAGDGWAFLRHRLDQHPHRLFHVSPQPGVCGELPRVRHLMKDQPAPEVFFGEVGVALPVDDVRLDEVQPFSAHRLGGHELRIVLTQDTAAEEGEHRPDVTIHARLAYLDDQRVRHSSGFENRVDGPAQDREIEVDPTLSVDRLELWERRPLGQPADQVE